MAIRPQPYRLKWPLTPTQVEGVDEMLQILFKNVRELETALAITGASISAINNATVASGAFSISKIPGRDGEDGLDGMPGQPGAIGPTGAIGPLGFPGADGEDFSFFTPPAVGFVPYTGALDNVDLGTHTLTIGGVTTFGAPARLKGYTVATLPAGVQGYVAFVTDSLAPTFLGVVAGGGAIVTPVFYDGTNWVTV